jgi:hypothetical protein
MKKNIKYIVFITILAYILPIISANGLVINGTQNLLNKTYGIDEKISVNITNTESFDFYNIAITQDFASVEKFNLSSGQSKVVEVKYTGDEDYDGALTFRGVYQASMGASNQTHIVNIEFENGFDKCNLNLIVGDSVTWVNKVNDYIKLISADSGDSFQTILEDKNVTRKFSTQETIKYYATRITKFTHICTIEVQGDEGLVHSYNYDAKLNLKLNINYPNTEVEIVIIETNYTINYNGEKEDILKVKNIGQKEAKNINLKAEWLSFGENLFDLKAGESKNIAYTIDPKIYNTSDTNKTYTKKLKVSGNFHEIEKSFYIFIPHSIVRSIGDIGDFDPEMLRNSFILYCKSYPEDSMCVALDSSGGVQEDNITQVISKNTLAELMERYVADSKKNSDFKKDQTETDINQTNEISVLSNNTYDIASRQGDIEVKLDSLSVIILFVIILFLSLSCGIFGIIVWQKRKNKIPNQKAGEMQW